MSKPNEEAIIIKVAMVFTAINASDLVETEAKAADLVSACKEHGADHAGLMRTLIGRLTQHRVIRPPQPQIVAGEIEEVPFDRALHPVNGSTVTLSVAGRPTKHAKTADTVAFVEMHQSGVTFGQYAVFGSAADLILAEIANDKDSTFVVNEIRAPGKIGQCPRAIVSLP